MECFPQSLKICWIGSVSVIHNPNFPFLQVQISPGLGIHINSVYNHWAYNHNKPIYVYRDAHHAPQDFSITYDSFYNHRIIYYIYIYYIHTTFIQLIWILSLVSLPVINESPLSSRRTWQITSPGVPGLVPCKERRCLKSGLGPNSNSRQRPIMSWCVAVGYSLGVFVFGNIMPFREYTQKSIITVLEDVLFPLCNGLFAVVWGLVSLSVKEFVIVISLLILHVKWMLPDTSHHWCRWCSH